MATSGLCASITHKLADIVSYFGAYPTTTALFYPSYSTTKMYVNIIVGEKSMGYVEKNVSYLGKMWF